MDYSCMYALVRVVYVRFILILFQRNEKINLIKVLQTFYFLLLIGAAQSKTTIFKFFWTIWKSAKFRYNGYCYVVISRRGILPFHTSMCKTNVLPEFQSPGNSTGMRLLNEEQPKLVSFFISKHYVLVPCQPLMDRHTDIFISLALYLPSIGW